jgi:hypothetical protein
MLTELSGADLPTYLEDGKEISSLKYFRFVSLGVLEIHTFVFAG